MQEVAVQFFGCEQIFFLRLRVQPQNGFLLSDHQEHFGDRSHAEVNGNPMVYLNPLTFPVEVVAVRFAVYINLLIDCHDQTFPSDFEPINHTIWAVGGINAFCFFNRHSVPQDH